MKHRPSPIVAVAIVAVVALAGCTNAAQPEPVEIELVDTTPAATGGLPQLVWNLPYGEPTSIDPALSSGESNSTVVGNMCESLLLQNADFSVTSGLADVEEVDDVTYRVVLKDGVSFWDGTPVTPDDVKFSIERIMQPELGSTWAGVLTSISAITIDDDRTLTISLSQPDAFFYVHLATPAAAIVQRAFTEAAGADFGSASGGVMCSGPLAFSEWKLGEHVSLTKHADYWDADRAALSDEVRFTFNTDAASATTAMQNGEINGAFNFPISALPKLSGGSGSVAYGSSLGLYGLMMVNMNDGPLADVKLREALALTIDYDGIRSGIFAGAAAELKTFTPKSAWGYSEGIYQDAWDALDAGVTDLDRAKALVEEAGAPTDPIVLSYYADLPEDGQVAAAIQSAAKGVGIEIELNAQTASENIAMYFDPAAREGTDMMIWAGYLDTQEPAVYYSYYTSEGVFNVAGFSDATFDQVVGDARRTLDDDERATMIATAQELYADNYVDLPIASQYTRVYQSEGVTGAVASQAFLYAPWAARVGTAD